MSSVFNTWIMLPLLVLPIFAILNLSVLDPLLKLSGVLGSLFFFLSLYLIQRDYSHFDIHKNSISDFCKKGGCARRFHLSIYIFSLAQLLFLFQLLSFYQIIADYRISLSLLVPVLMFLTIPYFSAKRFPRVHLLMAIVGFSLMFMGGIAFAQRLFEINYPVALVSMSIAMVVLVVTALNFLSRRTLSAWVEYIIFGGVFVWSLVNTFPLIISKVVASP